MKTLEELLQTESTRLDFKETLEVKKPKSWLKTVSAFANGLGGVLLWGIADDKKVVGVADIKSDIDFIGKKIKEFIEPMPVLEFCTFKTDDGVDVLAVEVFSGDDPPYFYSANGSLTAYVRIGSDSQPAPNNRLRELVMKGKNLTFDKLPTDYKLEDLTFSNFEATFKRLKKQIITRNDYISFGLCKPNGVLTYAGIMFSDECPLLQSRVFCTHWNGLDKSGGSDDAVDDKEFEEDLISQLLKCHDFVKMNSKVRWKKMSDHRVNKPDYADRAVFEALANALMHRDYDIAGSEVHVDMFDDRLEIYSPGGMPDGTLIQELNVEKVVSTRRNPIIAEIFHRLDYIERRGSGFKKMRSETSYLHGYTDEYAPIFESTPTAFHVIFKNMNYNKTDTAVNETVHDAVHDTDHDENKDDKIRKLIDFCAVSRSRDEMQSFVGVTHRGHFRTAYLKPLLETGQLKMTLPDKPSSHHQRYIKA